MYQKTSLPVKSSTRESQTDLKSTCMEKEGLKRCLRMLKDSGVVVRELCTDASTTIAAFTAREHPDIFHSFDTWHGAKNFGKKLGAVVAEKKNADLRPWVPDIINHFWYCSLKAEGSEDAILARWRGVLHHVVDVHEWSFGDNVGTACCEHEELLQPGGDKNWLEDGENKVILDTRIQCSLCFYVNFRHTGDLESFHDHILMYCAKRFSYKYPVYKARNFLACIDYQQHMHRPVLTTKKGEKRLHRLHCKKIKNWTGYEEEPKKYSYVPSLLTAILKHFVDSDVHLTSPEQLTPSDPRKLKRTLGKTSPPPTKMLMSIKKSRFEDTKSPDNL